MPSIEREQAAAGPRLTGFTSGGGFRVGGREYGAVLLTASAALGWAPPLLDALSVENLAPVLDAPPEFLLLGTGATQGQPSAAFRSSLEARGIGLEVMDSRAAARLWGVLRAEGRDVVAALYPLR